jgi:hypothetical protein
MQRMQLHSKFAGNVCKVSLAYGWRNVHIPLKPRLEQGQQKSRGSLGAEQSAGKKHQAEKMLYTMAIDNDVAA